MINDENLRKFVGADNQTTEVDEPDPVLARPYVGQEMDDNLIDIVETLLNNNYICLSIDEKKQLDNIMLANNKVFSTFEKIARESMYKHLKIERIYGKNTVIEQDAEDT